MGPLVPSTLTQARGGEWEVGAKEVNTQEGAPDSQGLLLPSPSPSPLSPAPCHAVLERGPVATQWSLVSFTAAAAAAAAAILLLGLKW